MTNSPKRPEKPLPRRRIGQTDVVVPVLGFGGAAIGNLFERVGETDARAALEAAVTTGATYLDTAPLYGSGLSETRIGAFLPRAGAQVVVSTKVGRVLRPRAPDEPAPEGWIDIPPFVPEYGYSYDGIMRSFDASLERLGIDRVDILYMHDIGAVTHGAEHDRMYRLAMDHGYRAMEALKEQGAVGAIGLGVNEWEVCQASFADARFDCFLLAGRYTLLEQTALETFIPECRRRSVSVVVGGPYNSGLLAATRPELATYNYAPPPKDIVARRDRLAGVCEQHGVPLQAVALQFPLAEPVVACVVPGARTSKEVRANAAHLACPLPSSLWDDLRSEGLVRPDARTPKEMSVS